MSKFCKSCGTGLESGAKFCGTCGAKLPHTLSEDSSKAAHPVKHRSKQRLLLLPIAVVLLLAMGIGFLPRILGDNYPYKQGAAVAKTVSADKASEIGRAKDTGWELIIPKGAVAEEKNLNMQVLTEDAAKQYQSEGFDFVGTPVEISMGEGPAYLGDSATIRLQIPKGQRVSKEEVDTYLAAYYNGERWSYIFPQISEVSEGYITFNTPHFSMFAAVEPTEEERMALYTHKMAVQVWEEEEEEILLLENVQETFEEAFEKMGIEDQSVKGSLLRSLAKESDFGALLVAAERGDMADYTAKCGEMAANVLIKHYKMEKALTKNIAGKGAAVATGLGKAAIQIYDGNYTDALKELSSAFIGYFPVGKAYQATIEVINASIGAWKDYEMDYAYQSYQGNAGGSAGPYRVSDEMWSLMCSAQMRGYIQRLTTEAKDQYCQVNNISRKKLDQDKALSDRITANVMRSLRRKMELRMQGEDVIAEKTVEYSKIIEGFLRDGLLARGSFRFDFDMDMEDRLRTLFAVRQNILDIFGGEMPVLKLGDSAEQNLNEAIVMWLTLGPGKRGEFYEWLEQKGYLKSQSDDKQSTSSSTTAKEPAVAASSQAASSQAASSKVEQKKAYAWVLAENRTNDTDLQKRLEVANKNENWKTEVAVSSSSVVFTNTYAGPDGTPGYDPGHIFRGNTSTGEVTWTKPKASYGPEEEVALQLTVKTTARDSKKPLLSSWMVLAQQFVVDEKGGQSGHAAYLADKDGNTSFVSGAGNNFASFDVTVTGKLGTGSKPGVRKAIRVSASGGVPVEAYYIYEWKEIR